MVSLLYLSETKFYIPFVICLFKIVVAADIADDSFDKKIIFGSRNMFDYAIMIFPAFVHKNGFSLMNRGYIMDGAMDGFSWMEI